MNPSFHHHPSFNIRNVLFVAALIRIFLIFYSEWHDRHSVVKYTDVDYRVFTDAAKFVLSPGSGAFNRAQGPWNAKELFGMKFNLGDPYTRETYRYTPLLAILLTPNGWLHPSWGKYLFAACDLLNGWLIYLLLRDEILPGRPQRQAHSHSQSKLTPTGSPAPTLTPSSTPKALATLYTSLHLFNPLVFSISTRGSSESVLALLVLLALYAGLRGRWCWAAVVLGVATHWKIYPVVYGVGCLGIVGAPGKEGDIVGWGGPWKELKRLVNSRTISFALISFGTYATLTGACYALWGYPFLYESYLYHLHRLDHRHNFSPYFYLTYLTYPPMDPARLLLPLSTWSALVRSPLVSFVPQMALVLGTGLLFGRRKHDLVFTWFIQTVAFVLFNKVCTSQYFLWYLLLLPMLLPRLGTTPKRGAAYVGVWVGTQALWLAEAYKLEFLGKNVFLGVWVRGVIYVLGNVWVLGGILGDYIVR